VRFGGRARDSRAKYSRFIAATSSHANGDGDGNRNTDVDRNTDGNCNRDADGNCNCNTDYSCANSRRDTNSDSHARHNPNCDRDR